MPFNLFFESWPTTTLSVSIYSACQLNLRLFKTLFWGLISVNPSKKYASFLQALFPLFSVILSVPMVSTFPIMRVIPKSVSPSLPSSLSARPTSPVTCWGCSFQRPSHVCSIQAARACGVTTPLPSRKSINLIQWEDTESEIACITQFVLQGLSSSWGLYFSSDHHQEPSCSFSSALISIFTRSCHFYLWNVSVPLAPCHCHSLWP